MEVKNSLLRAAGIAGVVAGVAAAVFIDRYPTRPLLATVVAGISLVLLLVFFVFHYEAFAAFSRRRATRLGINSVLMILLFLFIVSVVNLIARQHYLRLDLSAAARYSLAPQTESVVNKLDSDVRITVFSQEGSPSFRRAQELLEGYRYLNRRIVPSVLDLDRAPLLAKEYGVTAYDSVVVHGTGAPVVVQGISEERITAAVIKATRTTPKRIYFVTGQGERDPNSTAREGMSKAAARLTALGYDVRVLLLREVPDDAAVLVIAGPRSRYGLAERRNIETFLSKGGRLLVLADPGYDTTLITGQAEISVGTSLIIDPSSHLSGADEKTPLVTAYPDSPITRDFRMSTVFPGVAPVIAGSRTADYDYAEIVSSSPGARIARADRSLGEPGGQSIAVLAAARQGTAAVMVFGDSDFASNAFFEVAGNGNLFQNAVTWLAGEGELVSTAPARDDFVPLYLTPEQASVLFALTVVVIPVGIFGIGFILWVRRRRL